MGKAGSAVASAQGKMNAAQKALNSAKTAVGKDKAKKDQIASRLRDASHVNIPSGTPVSEAHALLEKKKNAIEKETGAMKKAIMKLKADYAKKNADKARVPRRLLTMIKRSPRSRRSVWHRLVLLWLARRR